jgi:hypothetical protein
LKVLNAVRKGFGVASSPNVGVSFFDDVTIAPANRGTFTLVGAEFAAGFTPVAIAAKGFRGGRQVYFASFSLHSLNMTAETLNFQKIDALKITASALPFEWESRAFLIDDLIVSLQEAPEPGSLLLFGIGMAATAIAASRRRRLNHWLQNQAEC